jgi:catalase
LSPLQFSFLLDDVGVPLNYRHMEGFGVHTFMLLGADGKETLVKFHWKPTCGELFGGGSV